MTDLELIHRIALSMLKGIGPVNARNLVAYCGGVDPLFTDKKVRKTLQEKVPGIGLRTTLIVGYPGEGEKEFGELLEFVTEARFDRLGVFTYSLEEGTSAFPLGDPVSQEEKERRRALIMEAQQEISEERNSALIGSRLKVLVERKEKDHYAGRTEHDAPEIDNEVIIRTEKPLLIGSFSEVEIVDAYEYDILGTI